MLKRLNKMFPEQKEFIAKTLIVSKVVSFYVVTGLIITVISIQIAGVIINVAAQQIVQQFLR
jgi:hypothetical protein